MTTEINLCPWEGRDMLKLNIDLVILFCFQIKILINLIRTVFNADILQRGIK